MRKANTLLLGLCLVSVAVAADDAEIPDLEFLEFLAEWQDEGEVWLDEQNLDELLAESEPATEVEND